MRSATGTSGTARDTDQIGGGYDPVVKHYARLAADYDRKWGRYCRRTLSEALHELHLSGDEVVLDVACGTGLLAEMMRSEWPGIRFTGIDLSEDMLAVARDRLSDVDWKLGTAERLPVTSAKYDLVTCTNAFHLVADQPRALAEFHRVLKPRGTLLLIDWCRDFTAQRLIQFAATAFGQQARRVLTLHEATLLMEDAAFEVRQARRFKATWLWGMFVLRARKSASTIMATGNNVPQSVQQGASSNRVVEVYAPTLSRRPTDTPAV